MSGTDGIGRPPGLLRVIASLGALYLFAAVLGFALLVAAFRLGMVDGVTILFYRGLVLITLVAVALFTGLALALRSLRPPGLATRDSFAAAIVSACLNLAFLVVVPVTVDRSISIFLLGEMAEHPDRALTAEAASRLFKTVYVDDYRQIGRRLREQAVSGNLDEVDGTYRINGRGLTVIAVAKATAWLFDSRAGLVAPRDAESLAPPAACR